MLGTLFTVALTLLSGDLQAAPATAAPAHRAAPARAAPGAMARPAPTPAERPAADEDRDGHEEDPPLDADLLPPEQRPYRSIQLEAQGITWLEPGQAGLIEAHPLVMGLAAMALATVTLLFFFLRGVKRPRNEDL